MSRRKENVRKACNWIDATIDTAVKNTDNLSSLERVRMMNALLNSIKTYTHRIKRTTWRNDENKLDKKITDEIKQIALRSFKNDLSNIKLSNDHPPATDW